MRQISVLVPLVFFTGCGIFLGEPNAKNKTAAVKPAETSKEAPKKKMSELEEIEKQVFSPVVASTTPTVASKPPKSQNEINLERWAAKERRDALVRKLEVERDIDLDEKFGLAKEKLDAKKRALKFLEARLNNRFSPGYKLQKGEYEIIAKEIRVLVGDIRREESQFTYDYKMRKIDFDVEIKRARESPID